MSGSGELAGRTAIVTGGGCGVGRAVAQALAAAGADVLITDRDVAGGEAVAAALSRGGVRAAFVAADPGSDADWNRVDAALEGWGGRLDVLVLNAEEGGPDPVATLTAERFAEVTRTNLKGAFLGLKHGVAAMRRSGRGGSVALMSSIVGAKVGARDRLHDAAAQAGVRMMAKAAALELGPEKIRVNSIHPGMARIDATAGQPPQPTDAIPLRRYGEPEEVAQAALFLASDRSRFMTGAEIVVDGGWIAR